MVDSKINNIKIIPKILMPLPDYDFDPTEVSIPWQACHARGWEVVISTEHGNIAQGDLHKLKGPLPGLLTASLNARKAYQIMTSDLAYLHPIPYDEINPSLFDGLLLPGGDGLRMHQYLDNSVLRDKVLQFWQMGKLIGAICHGVLVLARTIDPISGHSILYGRKVTAPPKSLDLAAYRFDAWLLKRGYIMYSSCVEDEVSAILARKEDLVHGPGMFSPFACTDGNLVTSRWYLDAEIFAEKFVNTQQKRME